MSDIVMRTLIYICIPFLMWLVLVIIGKSTIVSRARLVKKMLNPTCVTLILFLGMRDEALEKLFTEAELSWIYNAFPSLFILSVAFFLSRLLNVVVHTLYIKFDIQHEDNLRNRKLQTQLIYIRRIVGIAIWLVSIGVILLTFDELKVYGKSLLASAGVASVIIGFAAQKSIGNLIAGFQIAFTQPIRIDDAVVIEGEWGWVEEITLTYVVVRIWDKRRLVLPIRYVIEKPFQNWTRNSAQIIGTVMLQVSYETDIKKLREFFFSVLEKNNLWDKDVKSLQVTELKDFYIEVRALMSAKNSPATWDLRCEVREELVKYLQQQGCLPKYRIISNETK